MRPWPILDFQIGIMVAGAQTFLLYFINSIMFINEFKKLFQATTKKHLSHKKNILFFNHDSFDCILKVVDIIV